MKNQYIFLSSDKTESHPSNTFFDFTVEFPYTIPLAPDEWEIGLSHISFFKKEGSISPNMYLCCDIISASFCNNESSQILRFIPNQKGKTNLNFDNIFYQDVLPNTINTIRIYIRITEELKRPVKDETLYCTLHLRRKKEQ